MGDEEAVNSLSEVSQTDPGSTISEARGAPSSKYHPNAYRMGNEALDGGGVASPRSYFEESPQFYNSEPCQEIVGKSSTLGERESSVRKPEVIKKDPNKVPKIAEKNFIRKSLFTHSKPSTCFSLNCWTNLEPPKKKSRGSPRARRQTAKFPIEIGKGKLGFKVPPTVPRSPNFGITFSRAEKSNSCPREQG
jgi:hypothetical protein